MKGWAAFPLKPTMLIGLIPDCKYFFQDASRKSEQMHILHAWRTYIYTHVHTYTTHTQVQCVKLLLLTSAHNHHNEN